MGKNKEQDPQDPAAYVTAPEREPGRKKSRPSSETGGARKTGTGYRAGSAGKEFKDYKTQELYPWDVIRAEYVEGQVRPDGSIAWPSHADLSEKYGASRSTISRRAMAEKWLDLRADHSRRVDELRSIKRAELVADRAAQFDTDVLKAASQGVRHILGHFMVVQERFKASRGREPMEPNLLEQLSRALERFHRIGRLAMGEPGEITDNAVRHGLVPGGGGENDPGLQFLTNGQFIGALHHAIAAGENGPDAAGSAGPVGPDNDRGADVEAPE